MTALEWRNVTADFGGPPVVSDVTLALPRAATMALVGPNAAGKSTLLQVSTGALMPTSGEVLLGGERLSTMAAKRRATQLALVPQSARWDLDFTVRQMVELGRAPHRSGWSVSSSRDRVAVEEAMAQTDVTPLAERPFATLSGGERQRVLLARALAQEAPVLLLDEPTAHLDLSHQLLVWEVARRHAAAGGAVLAVLHDLTLAARFDLVALLDRGRLVTAGRPAEVLTPARLAQVWRVTGRWVGDEDARMLRLEGRL
jgi:iron complex transport system ATP-binding protein